MKNPDMPLRRTMCGTCPFRSGSPYAYLADDLAKSAVTEASRICHSTATNAINRRTGKPAHLCRGARDLQNKVMAAAGIIDEPTDAAWNEARVRYGYKPTVIKNPSDAPDT